ncbi:SCO7460 family lipoprotein [Streptomyces sp. NPDC060022]|uniref:SCO7460 family lipoprotein n=1 Tax=Streptomyces sp. NPDC060022 TaxID=3347039 RepID=UPI003693F7A1
MAGSCRRQLRAGITAAAAGSLALLLGACGVLSTEDDRQLAEKLAEKHFPGQLKVIGARTLFPGTGGSEITFSLTDDRDAVVRLGVDSEKGTCNYKACEQAMADAITRGRADAANSRVLRYTFKECGYEVIAVDPVGGAPYVVAQPTNSTVTQVITEVAACVQRWLTAGGNRGPLAQKGGVAVNLVSSRVAERRDMGKKSWPTTMRLSHSGLLASLGERPYYSVGYDIVGGRVDTRGRARIVRPFELKEEFGRTVEKAVREKLRSTYPQVQTTVYSGTWKLEPGTVDRQTGYVLFCERPAGKKRCLGDHAVVVTTDVRGNPVGELRIVRDIREGRGALKLPPL